MWRSQAVGGRNGVLLPPINSLQLLAANSCLLTLPQQQLKLGHLHLNREPGSAVLMPYQRLQCPHVDTVEHHNQNKNIVLYR